jgi:hypothetical protein
VQTPPPAPPPPKEIAEAKGFFDTIVVPILHIAVLALCIAGVFTIATWVGSLLNPSPSQGWVCWSITQTTSAGSQNSGHCEPAPGWHAEQSPSVGMVMVPDDAVAIRRQRYVVHDQSGLSARDSRRDDD